MLFDRLERFLIPAHAHRKESAPALFFPPPFAILIVVLNMPLRLSILLTVLFFGVTFMASSSEKAVRLKSSPTLAVTGLEPWKSVQKGVDSRKLTLERAQPAHTLDLRLFRFDTGVITSRRQLTV
jgi:hypothetical protein